MCPWYGAWINLYFSFSTSFKTEAQPETYCGSVLLTATIFCNVKENQVLTSSKKQIEKKNQRKKPVLVFEAKPYKPWFNASNCRLLTVLGSWSVIRDMFLGASFSGRTVSIWSSSHPSLTFINPLKNQVSITNSWIGRGKDHYATRISNAATLDWDASQLFASRHACVHVCVWVYFHLIGRLEQCQVYVMWWGAGPRWHYNPPHTHRVRQSYRTDFGNRQHL